MNDGLIMLGWKVWAVAAGLGLIMTAGVYALEDWMLS